MSDPCPYWWLWKPAIDVFDNMGDARPLAELLRDPSLDVPYRVRVILGEMLDPTHGIMNTVLVAKPTNAANKRIQRNVRQRERVAVIGQHFLSARNISAAVEDAAEELGITSRTLWNDLADLGITEADFAIPTSVTFRSE